MCVSELCGTKKKRLRGNSIFAYNGTTKVCALCGAINFRFGFIQNNGNKKTSLSKHIDLGLCKFVNLNLSPCWAWPNSKLRSSICYQVLGGQPHTYTRLLAHALQCEKKEPKQNFSCSRPGCNKKRFSLSSQTYA